MGRSSRRRQEARASNEHAAKLSVRLADLVAPYEKYCDTFAAFERLVAIGSAAWNLAVMPEETREGHLRALLDVLPASERATATQIIADLVAEKVRRFPLDHRIIVDASARDDGQSYHITVASSRSA